MHLFADVASGNTDAADVAYLVAAVLAFAAAVLRLSGERQGALHPLAASLLCLAVGAIALGLLLL